MKGRFLYQRKAKGDAWEDCDAPSLQSLKRGEHFELEIKSGELLPLLHQLAALYRLHGKEGLPHGRVELIRIGNQQLFQLRFRLSYCAFHAGQPAGALPEAAATR